MNSNSNAILLTQILLVFVICETLAENSNNINNNHHGVTRVNRPRIDVEDDEDISINRNRLSTGHTRCYCNLPTCISAGYMCMSASGGCFSNMVYQATTSGMYKGLHGCLELLSDKEQRDWCQIDPNMRVPYKKKTHSRSLLYCCNSDLCNHEDSPEITNLIDESKVLFNTSRRQVLKPRTQIEELKYSQTEVWFKAATIAVPICGTVIVLVLIMLAVRLLKNESNQHHRYKLGEKYVPTHNKNNFDHHYRIPLQNELMPIHQNPIYSNHSEELQQIRAPLLVQNELETSASPRKNVNARITPHNAYNHSLSEIDSQHFLKLEKNCLGEYAHSYPEVHHKNLFCDSIIVKNGLMKAKVYDKSNLRK